MSTQENDQVKRQVCVMSNEENTWKKYVYLENGIPILEKTVRVENGVEVPYEETAPITHILTLPPNVETEQHVQVQNIENGEINLVNIIQEPIKVEFVKFFNETRNIGSIARLENGIQVSLQYYKIENGQEVICAPPENERFYFVPLPNGSPDFSSHNGELSMYDVSTGMSIRSIPKANIIQIDNKSEIHLKENNQEISSALISKIKNLSDDDQILLFEQLSKKKNRIKTLDGKFKIPVSEDDLEKLFPTNAPPTLYDSVNPDIEFGIGRFLADQVNHLSSLLNVSNVKHYGEFGYGIYASKQINTDKYLDFDYRFTATGEKEAIDIAKHLKQQLNGIMRKIWLAAWSVGDGKKNHKFVISLLDLMRECYPERKSNFSEKETEEFYQTLKAMQPAQFTLVKKFKKKGRSKTLEDHEAKFIISFLQVHFETGQKNKTPSDVMISLFEVTPMPTKRERTRHLGAAIKRSTLKLHAKDIPLALFLQVRISQITEGGKKNIKSYDFTRSQLIEEANLQKTNVSNPRMANKLLLEKLTHCKDEGVLKKIPTKISDFNKLEW